MTTQLIFGRGPMHMKVRERQAKQEVKVVYFRSLLNLEQEDQTKKGAINVQDASSAQLAMFAL